LGYVLTKEFNPVTKYVSLMTFACALITCKRRTIWILIIFYPRPSIWRNVDDMVVILLFYYESSLLLSTSYVLKIVNIQNAVETVVLILTLCYRVNLSDRYRYGLDRLDFHHDLIKYIERN